MSESADLAPHPSVDDCFERFVIRTQGTPYTVTRTPDGILLRLDLDDLHWRTFLHAQGIATDYRVLLQFDPATRSYTRQQQICDVRWEAGAGAGGIHANVVRRTERGTFVHKEYRRYTAVGPDGGTAEYRFDTSELTDLVATVMDSTGWTRKTDSATRLGLTIAASVVGAIVLAGLIVLVVLLS